MRISWQPRILPPSQCYTYQCSLLVGSHSPTNGKTHLPGLSHSPPNHISSKIASFCFKKALKSKNILFFICPWEMELMKNQTETLVSRRLWWVVKYLNPRTGSSENKRTSAWLPSLSQESRMFPCWELPFCWHSSKRFGSREVWERTHETQSGEPLS